MKKSQINWLNQLIELFVVSIGITLAFMLDRAYENYKASQLEQKYLQSFFDDISTDGEQLKEILNNENATMSNIQRLFEMLKKPSVQSDSVMVLLSSMSRYYPFIQNASTYESIKNSGNLNLISDYFLKEEIFRYYQRDEERKLQEQNFSSFLNSYFIVFLFEHIDLESARIIHLDFIRSYEFKNLLIGYQMLLGQNFDIHQNMHQASLALSEKIQARLEK